MASKEMLSGEDLIIRHTGTIRELPARGLKEYGPNNSWLEKKQIENQLADNYEFLQAPRIEISKELSQAEWVPDLKKARVTKRCGKLWETLGHHQDNEDWLLPEEVLFLIECGELQLICDSVCISLEDCHSLIFSNCDCSEDEFKVYSYLTRTGLRVMRHSSSVCATNYEKQVRLDTVIQKQKRTPPRNVVEDDITVIVDDDCMVVSPVSNSNDTITKETSNSNKENIEVIEIEDDQDIVSDSDSDIIFISSPKDTNISRSWYPTIENCLKRQLGKLIDLCVESDDSNDEDRSLSKTNLLKKSRTDILSLFPSAVNGTSTMRVPNDSLLPPNVVPRYAEYKVNLNIKSETHQNNAQHNMLLERQFPLGNNLIESNNPLLMKAQEMQVMAFNMIQTASKLMSVFDPNNQTPNDLPNWQFQSNSRGRGMTHFQNFNPRGGMGLSHPRHFWPPRRNYGFRFPNRRKIPYRRNNSTWVDRKPYFNNGQPSFSRGGMRHYSNTPQHIVIISDEDDVEEVELPESTESDKSPLEKRKRKEISEDVNKRFKTDIVKEEDTQNEETLNSEITNGSDSNHKTVIKKEFHLKVKEESSSTKDIKMEIDIVSDSSTDSIIKREIIKDKLNDTEQVNNTIKSGKDLPNTPIEQNIKVENTKNKVNCVEDNQRSTDCTDSPQKEANDESSDKNDIKMKEPPPVLNKCTEELNTNDQDKEASSILNEEPSSVPLVDGLTNGNEDYDQINSWGEYKSMANGCEGEDCLLNLEQCDTYDNVLSTLQIFKKINVNLGNKKYKISFDAYLPESNFKKSLKILPNYRVIVLRSFDEIPFPVDIEELKIEYQDNIPFLFSIVSEDTVSFYLYDNVSSNTFCT